MTEALRSTGPAAGAAAAVKPKKRAVVVIDGLGNQRPMETLRPFVEAVWTSVPALARSGRALTWSQRDHMSESLELWCVSTNADTSGVQTDFFEFYWADMLEDTRLSSVISWLRRLLGRSIARVPPTVFCPWLVGWAVLVFIGVLEAALFLFGQHLLPGFSGFVSALLGTAIAGYLWSIRLTLLAGVIADTARYLTLAPANIRARTSIRLAGLELLMRSIKMSNMTGSSLSVMGSGAWWDTTSSTSIGATSTTRSRHDPQSPALHALQKAGGELRLDPEGKLAEFRNAQRDYFGAVRALVPNKWKISDFVTMGSPLAYAYVLMVDDGQRLLASEEKAIAAAWLAPWWARLDEKTQRIAALFRARAAQRELALCPPLTDKGDEFVYRPGAEDVRVPHHAAVFGPVRWTNIFAPCKLVFKGDVVGGPVAPIFGPGVKDIALTGAVGDMMLAHTHYWDEGRGDDEHLTVLRAALNFLDVRE